jgi:hypothetical protein
MKVGRVAGSGWRRHTDFKHDEHKGLCFVLSVFFVLKFPVLPFIFDPSIREIWAISGYFARSARLLELFLRIPRFFHQEPPKKLMLIA